MVGSQCELDLKNVDVEGRQGGCVFSQNFVFVLQKLHGTLPSDLEDLIKLRKLHLEGNDLAGPVPEFLANAATLGMFLITGAVAIRERR